MGTQRRSWQQRAKEWAEQELEGGAVGMQRRSWQQNIKQPLFIIVGIVVTIFVLIVFTLTVSKLGWDWTGFTSVVGPVLHPNEQYRPAKTLWDVLQLLIVPIILAIGGFLLNQIQKERDEKAAKEREKLERESREDNQRETTLKSYLDDMSDLLLNHGLRLSQAGDEVRLVARERTLTTFRRLDAPRNRIVTQFLQDANLLAGEHAIVDLTTADLENDDLRGANLIKVNFSALEPWTPAGQGSTRPSIAANLKGANLSGANLSGANLNGAILDGANLSGAILDGTTFRQAHLPKADLREAYLQRADFSPFLIGTDLSEANLSGAYLYKANLAGAVLRNANLSGAFLGDANLGGADLSEADLSGANLNGAKDITTRQLAEARSLSATIMPDGSTNP